MSASATIPALIFLDVHLAQPGVLGLQLLHAGHHGHIHAPVPGPPLVEGGGADAQLPAQAGNDQPGLHAFDSFPEFGSR